MKNNQFENCPVEEREPGRSDWNDRDSIGQRVFDEMLLYLENISSKPERNIAAELKEKFTRVLCRN